MSPRGLPWERCIKAIGLATLLPRSLAGFHGFSWGTPPRCSSLLNLSPRKHRDVGTKCAVGREWTCHHTHLIMLSMQSRVWRERTSIVSSHLSISWKVCIILGQHINVIGTSLGRKSQWEVKSSHSYSSCGPEEACMLRELLPKPWMETVIKELSISVMDRRKISSKASMDVLTRRYWSWRNNTVLDVELKQIITAQVATWGLTATLQQKQGLRTVWWPGDRASCNVSFQFSDFSETHLYICD